MPARRRRRAVPAPRTATTPTPTPTPRAPASSSTSPSSAPPAPSPLVVAARAIAARIGHTRPVPVPQPVPPLDQSPAAQRFTDAERKRFRAQADAIAERLYGMVGTPTERARHLEQPIQHAAAVVDVDQVPEHQVPAPEQMHAPEPVTVPTVCLDGVTPWPVRGQVPVPVELIPVPTACGYCGGPSALNSPAVEVIPGGPYWRRCGDCTSTANTRGLVVLCEATAARILNTTWVPGHPGLIAAGQAVSWFAYEMGRSRSEPPVVAWSHLDPDAIGVAYRHAMPHTSPDGEPCAGCGVTLSLDWPEMIDRPAGPVWLCTSCGPLYERPHPAAPPGNFADHLVSRLIGLVSTKPRLAEATGFALYRDQARPTTGAAWSYLPPGRVDKLRAWAQDHLDGYLDAGDRAASVARRNAARNAAAQAAAEQREAERAERRRKVFDLEQPMH